MKYLLFVVSLFLTASFAFSDHPTFYEDTGNDSFQSAYIEGYRHGSADKQSGENFDFRHAYEYQLAKSEHSGADTHRSCDFRVGYIEGYSDGYFKRNPVVGLSGEEHHSQNSSYGSPSYSPSQGSSSSSSYPTGPVYGSPSYNSRSGDGVAVYTDTGFRGRMREFGVGRYPYLESGLNDEIESIQVSRNVRVILFDQGNFRGSSIVVQSDSFDLGGFKRKAASMIVERLY